jgi:hypothetical protein
VNMFRVVREALTLTQVSSSSMAVFASFSASSYFLKRWYAAERLP